jgi:hypothetical protein
MTLSSSSMRRGPELLHAMRAPALRTTGWKWETNGTEATLRASCAADVRRAAPWPRTQRLLADDVLARLQAGLAAGDAHDEVWYAHVVKEQLRAVYHADDEQAARGALAEFYDAAAAAGVPECDRLARTIRRWEAAVLAYYTTEGLSNVKTEATNALMKKVQRIGHGFATCATTGYACCCTTAASHGKINPPRSYGSALPATWRRPRFLRLRSGYRARQAGRMREPTRHDCTRSLSSRGAWGNGVH